MSKTANCLDNVIGVQKIPHMKQFDHLLTNKRSSFKPSDCHISPPNIPPLTHPQLGVWHPPQHSVTAACESYSLPSALVWWLTCKKRNLLFLSNNTLSNSSSYHHISRFDIKDVQIISACMSRITCLS